MYIIFQNHKAMILAFKTCIILVRARLPDILEQPFGVLENNGLTYSGSLIARWQIEVVDLKQEDYLFADLIYYEKGEEDISCIHVGA